MYLPPRSIVTPRRLRQQVVSTSLLTVFSTAFCLTKKAMPPSCLMRACAAQLLARPFVCGAHLTTRALAGAVLINYKLLLITILSDSHISICHGAPNPKQNALCRTCKCISSSQRTGNQNKCISRESNPGHIDDNDVLYH